jgi:hypothetical protein
MKKLLYILVFITIGNSRSADAQCNCKFSSQQYVGLLEGEKGSAFQLQTVNGLKYKTWFTGIGVGLDYYTFRSVPVFLSVNKEFLIGRNSIYVLLDAGYNIPWYKREEGRGNNFISSDFSGGLYWSGGVGYKISVNKNRDAVLLNLGYSFKRMQESQEMPVFCINPPCKSSFEKYDYKLNRLSLKLGYQF